MQALSVVVWHFYPVVLSNMAERAHFMSMLKELEAMVVDSLATELDKRLKPFGFCKKTHKNSQMYQRELLPRSYLQIFQRAAATFQGLA